MSTRHYRTLGKTSIDVSPLTIGAWQLGGPLFFYGKPDGHPDPAQSGDARGTDRLRRIAAPLTAGIRR